MLWRRRGGGKGECLEAGEKFECMGTGGAGKFPLKKIFMLFVIQIWCYVTHVNTFSDQIVTLFTRTAAIYISCHRVFEWLAISHNFILKFYESKHIHTCPLSNGETELFIQTLNNVLTW